MTDGSHELALYAINDGPTYERRLEIARGMKQGQPVAWAGYAASMARQYNKEFGEGKWTDIFSTEDVLLCAVELAEYYAEHIKEFN